MKKTLFFIVAFCGILFYSYGASAQIFAKYYLGGDMEVSAVFPADMVLLDLKFNLTGPGTSYCLIEVSGQAIVDYDENVLELCIDVDSSGPITSTCRDVVILSPFYTSVVASLRRGTHNATLVGNKRFSTGFVGVGQVSITATCDKRGSIEYYEPPSVK